MMIFTLKTDMDLKKYVLANVLLCPQAVVSLRLSSLVRPTEEKKESIISALLPCEVQESFYVKTVRQHMPLIKWKALWDVLHAQKLPIRELVDDFEKNLEEMEWYEEELDIKEAKKRALIMHLDGIEPSFTEEVTKEITEEITEEGNNEFDYNGQSYLILTEEEKDEAVRKCIQNDLSGFINNSHAAFFGMTEATLDLLKNSKELKGIKNKVLKELAGDKLDELVKDCSKTISARNLFAFDDKEHVRDGFYIYLRD